MSWRASLRALTLGGLLLLGGFGAAWAESDVTPGSEEWCREHGTETDASGLFLNEMLTSQAVGTSFVEGEDLILATYCAVPGFIEVIGFDHHSSTIIVTAGELSVTYEAGYSGGQAGPLVVTRKEPADEHKVFAIGESTTLHPGDMMVVTNAELTLSVPDSGEVVQLVAFGFESPEGGLSGCGGAGCAGIVGRRP